MSEATGAVDNAALCIGVYSEHSARLYARSRHILLGVTKVKRSPKGGRFTYGTADQH